MNIFRCSGINEWLSCTAWMKFTSDREVHPTASEGTRIHAYAESVLNGELPKIDLNPEHKEIAKRYIEFVNDYKKYCIDFQVEAPVTVMKVGDLICKGTADFVCRHQMDMDDQVLTVIDLKTGRNKCSELQIKTYLAGMYQHYGDDIDRAEGIYYYGRTGEYQVLKYSKDDLDEHLTMIEDAMIEYGKGIVKHQAGDQCTYCHMNDKCMVLDQHLEKIKLYEAPIDLLEKENKYIEMKSYNSTTKIILDELRKQLLENKDALLSVKYRGQKKNVVGKEAIEAMVKLIKEGNHEILEELKPSVATCKKYELPMEQSTTDMLVV